MIAMAVTFIAGLLLLGSTAYAAPNPPGNNGTVKIDREPFDDHPDNQPHVGCTFQVDFYGFDEGDVADVVFTAHPPTSELSGGGEVVKEDLGIDVGGDDNSGGGSEDGLDASETYTLDFSGIDTEPSAQQGFHVKLTVTVTSPQSVTPKFNKYKVFWVQPCESSDTTTSSSSTTSTTMGGGGGGGDDTSSSSSTLGGGGGTGGGGTGGGADKSKRFLPRSGSNALPLMVAGLSLLALGAASLLASHRRQRHTRA